MYKHVKTTSHHITYHEHVYVNMCTFFLCHLMHQNIAPISFLCTQLTLHHVISNCVKSKCYRTGICYLCNVHILLVYVILMYILLVYTTYIMAPDNTMVLCYVYATTAPCVSLCTILYIPCLYTTS